MTLRRVQRAPHGPLSLPNTRTTAILITGRHIFQLFYALALTGRFPYEVAHLLHALRLCHPGLGCDDANRALIAGSLLAQGFFHVSSTSTIASSSTSANTPHDQDVATRIERIWVAARTFVLRGMILGGDCGSGCPGCHESEVDQEEREEKVGEEEEEDDFSWLPEMVPRPLQVDAPFSSSLSSSLLSSSPFSFPSFTSPPSPPFSSPPSFSPFAPHYLWACAGCILGARGHNTTSWHMDHLQLHDVAAVVRRLLHTMETEDEEGQRAEQEPRRRQQQQSHHNHHHHQPQPCRRVWAPLADTSPLIVDLYRRLDAKDQQLRLLRQQLLGEK